MTQITENQHFVPQFYLKRFSKKGQIQVFDVRAKRIGRPSSCKKECYEKFFYAAENGVQDEISQAFEDVFCRIEYVSAKALRGVIERAVAQHLTNGDLDELAYFMIVQWLRTRFFRARLQKIQSELMKWILKQLASLPGFQDHIRSMAEGTPLYPGSAPSAWRPTNNAQHLNFIGEEEINGFRNLLLVKKWRITLSDGPYRFITSDNPVAEWIPPRTGLIPVTFMDRRYLLALTPNILIETGRPDSMNPEQQPVDRVSYHTANEKAVLMFNKVLANSAYEYAYASQRDELEQLLNLSRSRGALSPAGP